MLRAWILAGLFFMALPGTLLGFSNLMAISAHHGLGALPAAWMEGHGHAQVFGWIGSFILGIGFYSQPAHGRSVIRLPLSCFILWESGVAMRWFANIYGWHWRALLPVSAGFELIAVILFLYAASHHKLPASTQGNRAKSPMELWMVSVLIGTSGLASAVIFNFVECVRLALRGRPPFFSSLARPEISRGAWLGICRPSGMGIFGAMVAGFSRNREAQRSLVPGGVMPGCCRRSLWSGWVAEVRHDPVRTRCCDDRVCICAFAERPHGAAKTQGIHPSFPVFVRLSYAWLIVAGSMSVWAAFADVHGGIWGASRHALTVGFAATMVFAIGPRILPHFAGIQSIFSKRLMLLSLLCLQSGCLLRVSSEPLAYEGLASFAWKVLPVSGMLELVWSVDLRNEPGAHISDRALSICREQTE